MLAFCFIGPYWVTGELVFSCEPKAGALLLGRCFYDENALCSQDHLYTWLLSGIELNMHKLFVFTCFLRAKAGALHFATVFYSRIGLLSHRRYASSLLFTCVYWMESRRFVFVDGAFKGNTLFARFTLRVLECDWVEQVFTCFLHVKRALYFWKRWFHTWKTTLCSQSSRKGLLNGFEFSTWMQSGPFAFGKVMLRGKDLDIYLARTDSLWSYLSSML